MLVSCCLQAERVDCRTHIIPLLHTLIYAVIQVGSGSLRYTRKHLSDMTTASLQTCLRVGWGEAFIWGIGSFPATVLMSSSDSMKSYFLLIVSYTSWSGEVRTLYCRRPLSLLYLLVSTKRDSYCCYQSHMMYIEVLGSLCKYLWREMVLYCI